MGTQILDVGHPAQSAGREEGRKGTGPRGEFSASFQPANAASTSDLGLRPRLQNRGPSARKPSLPGTPLTTNEPPRRLAPPIQMWAHPPTPPDGARRGPSPRA